MRTIWCAELEDLLSISRTQGWLFYIKRQGKHYYYVYAGADPEFICLAIEVREPLKGKYVTIDDDGKIIASEKPIMPSCSRIVSVTKDEGFEKIIPQS